MHLFVSLSLLCLSASVRGFTQAEYDTLVEDMRDFFVEDSVGRAWMARTLRLSFHDCVGGCNGCVNVYNNSANAGLSDVIDILEDKYAVDSETYTLSRADYWAIAGIGAVKAGIDIANRGCSGGSACNVTEIDDYITFRWNRTDCDTAPYDYTSHEEEFPEPVMGTEEMYEWFHDEDGFNFTDQEVVALMGGHTLGAAGKLISGYSGPWITDEPRIFDNKYYINMLNTSGITWEAVDVSSRTTDARWQYEGTEDEGMMFNTDFACFYNIVTDEEGEPSCHNPHDCDDYSTYSIAKEYADDVDLWIQDFGAVFTKMLDHGSDNLADLE